MPISAFSERWGTVVDSDVEARLRAALTSCFATPFIDDVEDFVWESVWAYAMRLALPDPLSRTKRLFDVVDVKNHIGWSAKTLKWATSASSCEFVIQRADVFKKADELGFKGLTIDSPAQRIGDAVLTHWLQKVNSDSSVQGVKDKRVCILFKDQSRRNLSVAEGALHIPDHGDISWNWTDNTKTGLQGKHPDGSVVYRWYRNQKQLFERMNMPKALLTLQLSGSRLSADTFNEAVLSALNPKK